MDRIQSSGWVRIIIVVFAVGMLFHLAWSPVADAQGQRGGPRLAPEKQEAAWTLHSTCVAKELELSGDNTKKLVTAYIAARKSHGKAMEALRGEGGGGGGQGRWQRFRELSESEGKKLETAFSEFLSKEQTKEATTTLGSFDWSGDRYIDTLASYKLGDEKLFSALKHVSGYIVDYSKARADAMAGGDWQSIRTARQELKGKLDTSLASILSEEQLSQWKEATQFRGRGGN